MKVERFTVMPSPHLKFIDLPMGMPVPSKGDMILVEGEEIGVVKKVHYHIYDGDVVHITVICE